MCSPRPLDNSRCIAVASQQLAPQSGRRTALFWPGRRMTLRSDNARSVNLDELVASIMARSRPLRLVAVDGPGGAGKSTFRASCPRRPAEHR